VRHARTCCPRRPFRGPAPVDLGMRRKRGWRCWVKRGNAVVRRQVEQVGCVLREVRGGGRSKSQVHRNHLRGEQLWQMGRLSTVGEDERFAAPSSTTSCACGWPASIAWRAEGSGATAERVGGWWRCRSRKGWASGAATVRLSTRGSRGGAGVPSSPGPVGAGLLGLGRIVDG
jgi:hypothetical protein